jgi:histidinol-phosphate aminotransferase
MSEEKKDTNPTTGRAAKLARPNVLSLHPYRCARDDYESGVLLDANENALGPASLPTNSLDPYDNGMELERYPSPYQRIVKQLLCDYRNSKGSSITPEHVFCGVGSDEAIDLLIRIFCAPGNTAGVGDAIMITPPTYGMYKVCANVNDVGIQSVPLTPDFDLQIPEILKAVTPETKLLFICSPGNPTAKSIPLEDVRKIASSSLYNGIVIVDEAYVDFSSVPSATSLVTEFDNVVVLQTLSKAFGLAGIRCGFAIGPPDVIQLMNNVKAPYNVNKLTSDAAANALKNTAVLEKNCSDVLVQRDVVRKELEGLDFVLKVYPSDSNFLLFRVKEKANELYKTMADKGVVSRFRGNEMHCNECIRVTIGTPDENRRFLEMLKTVYGEITC